MSVRSIRDRQEEGLGELACSNWTRKPEKENSVHVPGMGGRPASRTARYCEDDESWSVKPAPATGGREAAPAAEDDLLRCWERDCRSLKEEDAAESREEARVADVS